MPISGPASSQQTAQDPLRINISAPLNHPAARNAQQDTSIGPKTSTGIPSDLAKYGGKYNQGYSIQDRKPSLPVKLSQERGDSPTTSTYPKTAPLRKNSGFKLPSVAYSPNPNEQGNDSEEEEEDESDDEDDNSINPSRGMLGTRSTMTLSPPKLPLLFFEEDSIGQIDFAYQTSGAPSSTHSQTNLTGLNGYKSSERFDPANRREANERKGSHSSTRATQIEQSNGNERNADTSESVLVRKSSPRPFTPPINTALPKKQVQSPEKDEGDTGDSQGARGHSFYWHSPGSGSGSDEEDDHTTAQPNGIKSDHKADSQPENEKKEDSSEPVIKPLVIMPPIVNTVPESSLTSATALGFGGPSDWQHFNDYDAEEVDDLALYISDKPKTVELPAGTPVKEDGDKLDSALSPRRLVAAERDTLPTIQERASELLEDGKVSEASQTKTPDRSSAASTESQGSLQKSVIERTTTQQSSLTNQDESEGSIQSSLKPSDTVLDTSAKKSSSESIKSEIKKESEAIGTEKKRTGPSHVTHSRVTSDPSVQSSGLNSPVDEDDGRERIIISLQVPDGEDDKKKKEPSPPRTTGPDDGSRERNLTVATNLEPKVIESPELLRTGRMSVFPQSIEMENPYAGLDPWAKASLNRYVKLLKEEAAAQTDEEKFTLFINFMDRERRNRTALYDMDEDSENESTLQFNKVTDDSGKIRSRVSLKRKAAPIIPAVDTMPAQPPQAQQPVRADTMPLGRPLATNERQNSESSLSNSKTAEKNQQPMTAPPQQASFPANTTAEETYTPADTPNEEKPQPLNTRQVKEKGSGTFTDRESTYIRDKVVKEKSSGKTGLSLSALKKKALDLGGRSIAKDRSTPPINLQTLLMKASDDGKKPSSPVMTNRTAAPQTVPTPPPIPPTNVEPQTAATPEKRDTIVSKIDEAEGRQYEGDKAANRQTIYRPFSGHLRQRSVLRSNPESKRSSVFDRKSLAAEASFPRSPINAIDAKPFEEHQKPRTKPVNYRYTILEPLLLVVPQEGITHSEPQQLTHLRQSMEAIRDDFSFIHQTVLKWDAEAKKGRERNEKERQARTAQNEARIDALFNENEIGYGDISQLEAEFKRQEATKKAQEDREEVDTFVMNVFDVVWKRINYEIDQLSPLYEQCTELVSNASAGRTMFEDFEDTVPVASAMEVLLTLYQKLMIRYQKAFEAVLERDRRLKKTEVAPWNAMGSNEKVKKIEKRFEDAEKKAILEFCRQRDERAGFLMEVLDHNTLRGVGANQDYMESIMQAVRKISIEIQASGSSIADDDVVSRDEVLKAQTITTSLARSSEQLVHTFHVADMLLNAADYEVSVANAKLSNADAAAFKRLREAKAKEDNKLVMDLEHRMNLIRGDTSRTQEEINKLLLLISRKTDSSEALPRGSIEKQGLSGNGLEEQDRGSRVISKGAEDISNNKARRLPRKM